MRTKLRSKFSLLFVALAALIAIPAVALADTITADPVVNTVVVDNNVSKAPGETGSAKVWLTVNDNSTDPVNGCNANTENPVKITLSSNDSDVTFDSSGTKANPASLTGCDSAAGKEIGYTVSSSATGPFPKTVEVTASGSGGRVTGGGTNQPAYISDTFNITITAPAKQNQTINFTSTAPTDAVYGGTYTPAATGGGSGNAVTFGASGACSYNSSTGVVTMTSTGTCTVSANQAGNTNYNAATEASQQFSVAQRPITGSFTADNKEYDGDTSASVLTRSLNGVLGDDVVTLNGGTATFADKNVSTGKTVTLTGATLGGANAGNYSLTSVSTTTANITAKALTITGLSAEDKVFDNNTNATIIGTAALDGVISPDVVTLSGTPSGAFNNALVGNDKPVTVSGLSLSGADASNYSLTQLLLSADITAWTTNGFFQPVDMGGVYNTVKGGSTVPLKFELFAGATELTATTSVTSLQSQKVSCTPGTSEDAIEATATGGTSLRYDSTSGQFIYNWKTPSGAGACYKVTMTAQDGTTITAFFKMK